MLPFTLTSTFLLYFPSIFRMLHEAEKNDQTDIISFNVHGKSFAVHKPKEFILDIMPKYFAATSKMNTFVKQLNLYCFKRISSGPEKGSYYHEQFVKGNRHLCKQMKRKRVNSSSSTSAVASSSVVSKQRWHQQWQIQY